MVAITPFFISSATTEATDTPNRFASSFTVMIFGICTVSAFISPFSYIKALVLRQGLSLKIEYQT
jgi:hypothetical protein